MHNILEVRNLTVPGILHGISLALKPGEKVALIGESGAGKSITALAIMGLYPASGEILFDNRLIDPRTIRGKRISMVFQEPMTALDPLMKIGTQLKLVADDPSCIPELLADVDLDSALMQRYPHELSGGQRQRVLIAMALLNNPEVLIADEPTTALDATTERQIVELLARAAEKRHAALLLITHDITLVRNIADRIVVLKNGRLAMDDAQRLFDASQPGTPAPPENLSPTAAAAVEIKDLQYKFRDGTPALFDINLTVKEGGHLGIVGSSGSGKTTLLRLIAGLNKPTSGEIKVASPPQMIFQDPASSFDPRMPVGKALMAPGREAELLAQVGLDPAMASRYPRSFSGGQRQRLSLARVLARDPQIILADEAVSALDVSVRASIIKLLKTVTAGRTMIFVSHDLSVLRELCTDIAVMRAGRIIERGEHVWTNPQQDYTKELLADLR
ncbi:ATP-binding cassette domain-containing protein [Corynebacterium caspium]|uniref:ATP-binding cassette domain-containing protein n=1 Tax=Corynebacterium caspium TaxID=234828 RepID=UPI00036A5785|nr:ABC transporter ATP-binding protein [Corynebacterium caspium]WKD58872.1 Glutathione import ATP-binding protein GsiA [Corynebacterium caspium DSM 44850]